MQWEGLNSWDKHGAGRPAVKASASHNGGLVRFMVAIDNFDHVCLAYGSGVADAALARVRQAIHEWLGDRAELHFESAGIFYGTLVPADAAQDHDPLADRRRDSVAVNRMLINPPLVFLPHEGGAICLALSGSWAIHDGRDPTPARPFEGGCRAPFFGAAPGRGGAWAARYRADMAVAASLLMALETETGATDAAAGAPPVSDDGLTAAVGTCSTAGSVFRMQDANGRLPRRTPGAMPAPSRADKAAVEPIVFSWRPVRDGGFGRDVLFYEMVPQICGRDGRRRDLGDSRQILERLGLAVALDQFVVHCALDLLESDPDVALAVQVSAQSVSACPRWGSLFRRLTGSRSVAGRLTVAITETASFPDFAEAVQFVSRLQAFGSAVAVDNFGLGYTSIRELLALAPDIVCIDPFFVRFAATDAPEGAVLGHLAGLGGLLASTVVVKGVTTERQSRLALEVGIRWQQGDYLGGAAVGRPWAASVAPEPCRLPHRTIRKPRAA